MAANIRIKIYEEGTMETGNGNRTYPFSYHPRLQAAVFSFPTRLSKQGKVRLYPPHQPRERHNIHFVPAWR